MEKKEENGQKAASSVLKQKHKENQMFSCHIKEREKMCKTTKHLEIIFMPF